MSQASRRRANLPRPSVEPLEARALLAIAGSLDPTFGGGYGQVTAPLGVPVITDSLFDFTPPTQGFYAQANSVAPLPDGGVVVLGKITSYQVTQQNPNTQSSALAVEELNSDGTPKTSFGTDGLVELLDSNNLAFQMAVQTDGQVVLASVTTDASGNPTYLAIRLNANGSVDTTFGTDGVAEYPSDVTIPNDDRIDDLAEVLVQSNDQIVLVGSANSNGSGGFAVVRLDSDGLPDITYGTEGTADVPNPDGTDSNLSATAATLLEPSGQLVVTGNLDFFEAAGSFSRLINSEVAVTRLTPDGSVDTTFGGSTANGLVLIPYDLANPSTDGENISTAVAVQPTTGDLLIAGGDNATTGNLPVATLYRLNPDGTFDTTFGTGGLTRPLVSNDEGPGNMAVESNGEILLVGSVAYAMGGPALDKFDLLRLNPDGSPDGTFGNTSTPGLLQTDLTSTGTQTPAISTTTGDIYLAGTGTVSSPAGLTYGFSVDSILPAATTGPAASPTPAIPPADFAGMGYSDAAVYDPTTASFLYLPSSVINSDPYSVSGLGFGIAGAGQTIPAAADYQGLGFDEIAAYLSASGIYAILPTGNSPGLAEPFGVPGAGQTIPVPADYYGTGQADVAVYIPAQGIFAIQDPTGQTAGKVVPSAPPG